MFRRLLLLLTLVLSRLSAAQMLPPEEGPVVSVITMDVKVQIGPRVKGLSWNTTDHRHEATFNVSATLPNPPVGYGQWEYTWGAAGGTNYAGGEFANIHAASTTFKTFAPGQALPTCTVVGHRLGPLPPARAEGNDSLICFAIGGPIQTSVIDSKPSIYVHVKNDPTKPFYMTYLNYSHSIEKPLLSQETQNCKIELFPQPPGTTVTWELPDKVHLFEETTLQPGGMANQLSIRVAAEGEFEVGIPKAKFSFSYPYDPSVTGETYDDSAETEESKTVGSSTTWRKKAYELSGRKPGELVTVVDSGESPNGNFPTATAWTNIRQHLFQLVDTLGDPMPGIQIQERFIDGNPLNLSINNSLNCWFTIRSSNNTNGGNGIGSTDGRFQTFDFLSYVWFIPNPTTLTTDHRFFAGVSDATAAANSGVPVGTYTITFVPGTPGSASQSKTGS